MRIGLDFDDTLVDTSEAFNRFVKRHKLTYKKTYSDFLLDWKNKKDDKVFDNYLYEVLSDVRLVSGAKEVLKYLTDTGNKVYIITARRNHKNIKIEDITRDFIKKEKLNISGIYFCQDKKSDTAKKLNIDLMIDDSKTVYDNMKKENIDCILFRQDIKTWEEILDYIKKKGV